MKPSRTRSLMVRALYFRVMGLLVILTLAMTVLNLLFQYWQLQESLAHNRETFLGACRT